MVHQNPGSVSVSHEYGTETLVAQYASAPLPSEQLNAGTGCLTAS
jgi:hypothetical protein